MRSSLAICGWLVLSLGATCALACPPAPGNTIAGPVLNVPGDGVICVALGPRPERWFSIVLTGPNLDRQRLMAAAFGKRAVCHRSQAGWRCQIGGQDLTSLARGRAIGLSAKSWR